MSCDSSMGLALAGVRGALCCRSLIVVAKNCPVVLAILFVHEYIKRCRLRSSHIVLDASMYFFSQTCSVQHDENHCVEDELSSAAVTKT